MNRLVNTVLKTEKGEAAGFNFRNIALSMTNQSISGLSQETGRQSMRKSTIDEQPIVLALHRRSLYEIEELDKRRRPLRARSR